MNTGKYKYGLLKWLIIPVLLGITEFKQPKAKFFIKNKVTLPAHRFQRIENNANYLE